MDNIQRSITGGVDFLYLLGIGMERVFTSCVHTLIQQNRGVLVIEPNIERFILALRMIPLSPYLRSGHVFWAVGDRLEEQISQIWDESLCYAARQAVLHPGRPLEDAQDLKIQTYIQNESTRRKDLIAKRVRELPKILVDRKPPRDFSKDPLRIWSYLDNRGKARYSIIQHVLMRTILYHLHGRGFKTEYTVLRDGFYYPPYYRILRMALFEPDLIFLCNESPAFESALGSELSRSLPIPKVTWFADDPVHMEHLVLRHRVSPDETCLVADYEWSEPLLSNGAERTLYMPGAATKIRRGKQRGSRQCEIVFVGQVRDHSGFFQQLTPAWREYCQRVVSEKLRFPRMKFKEIMAQFPAPARMEPDWLDELRQKLLWEANTRFRAKMILQLAKYDLRIYGNDDWLRFLPSELTGKCFRGVLRFQHLFEVYRNAKIVLNIHSLQSYTCLNVRDFDVPAAGGFLLSDWLPRADEVFIPGFVGDLPLKNEDKHEIFFYRSISELHKLVNYFLEHEEERNSCIERARKKVVEQHTYQHRAEWLAELFREKCMERSTK